MTAAVTSCVASDDGSLMLELELGEDLIEYVTVPVHVVWSERRHGLREFPGVDTADLCWGEARYTYAVRADEPATQLVARLQTAGALSSDSELLAAWRATEGPWLLWRAHGDAFASLAAEE